MAEYKNGFNYRGNMSVEKEDYAPDVQTGRAVFVDEDKYTNDATYKAKVDKCVEEGFHRISEGDTPSGGGGGTEPLIVNISSGDSEVSYALDRTWQEIHDAFPNVILRKVVRSLGKDLELFIAVIRVSETAEPGGAQYNVDVLQSAQASFTTYCANDPNGYPHS